MLQSLADMLRRTLDQRIRIEVDARADRARRCMADPGQLESALLNIAINARDAMPRGRHACAFAPTAAPRCRTTLARRARDRRPAALRRDRRSPTPAPACRRGRQGARLRAVLHHQGGRPRHRPRPSTVYGFVKQSQGAVAIESAPGEGTTVTLYLPRAARRGRGATTSRPRRGAVPPGLRVLLVEDDAEVRNVVRRSSRRSAAGSSTAPSGEQALLALGAGATFDLLLTDIALGAGHARHRAGARGAARAARARRAADVRLFGRAARADRESPPSWELLRKPYARGSWRRRSPAPCAGSGARSATATRLSPRAGIAHALRRPARGSPGRNRQGVTCGC